MSETRMTLTLLALTSLGAAGSLTSGGRLVLLGLALVALGLVGGRIHRPPLGIGKAWPLARFIGGVLASSFGLFLILAGPGTLPADHRGIEWISSEPEGLALAKEQQKPVMIDFWATWCKACKELDRSTYTDPAILAEARAFVNIKVDYTDPDEGLERIYKKYRVQGLPTVIFIDPKGQVRPDLTVTGFLEPKEFLPLMVRARTGGEAVAEASGFEEALSSGWLAALAFVFVGGILTSFTPCVYPLIPITIATLGGTGQALPLGRRVMRSVVYVLGIILTYSILGVASASAGEMFGQAMANPWMMGIVAAVLFLMALSMLGLFEIRLPSSVQTWLATREAGGWAGVLVMGLVAGLVAAPCVGPVLVSVLVYIARSQSILLGFVLMFTFALGMGMLFLVLGIFSGALSLLPRAGTWMNGIKALFGVALLAVALYFLNDALPQMATLLPALAGLVS